MFCFALFLRQALSVPYAGLSHLWVSGLQWNIPNSTIYLGRPKSPSCPSVPGSEIGTQARLQSSRTQNRTGKEMFQSFHHWSQEPKYLLLASQSWWLLTWCLSSLGEQGRRFCSWSGPSQSSRATGQRALRRARGNFLTPKVVQEAPLHISPKNWLKWCPKGLLQKEPIYSLKIKYIDFHLIINYKSLESTENLYREIKISN